MQSVTESAAAEKEIQMARTVLCSKFKKELPGLEKPPFAGEMGKRIFESVSAEAWNQWSKDVQIKVLNEYRLNMGDPRDYQVLVDQMMRFLGLEAGTVAEVENAERGRRQ
jgi:Fe-S cluster biosynthesis and repair protein YggX